MKIRTASSEHCLMLPVPCPTPLIPPTNIVVFISDDHGQLDSQGYGSTEVRTPNMAKLADEGMKLTQACRRCPPCFALGYEIAATR